jgi:hypothetical protein
MVPAPHPEHEHVQIDLRELVLPLAAHVLRRLVVTQGYEFRVTQVVHVGRVRVLDLRDKLRFQPAAFGHLLGR